MSRYTSHITFLYYSDYEKGCQFLEEVLQLDLIMDQGFAKVYKAGEKSFIGAVKRNEGSIDISSKGGTLVSLNTHNVDAEYNRIKELNPPGLTELKVIEKIPLKSFFFKDYEGYDFEIQQFLNDDDLLTF